MDMVQMLVREMALRADYLPARQLSTIYFGGGTPSLLTPGQMADLFSAIDDHFTIAPDAEITLEANPDDLTPEKLNHLRDSPINRLSIGIQSFSETDLRFMNRAHTAQEALSVVSQARRAGFEQLTIDLIYGSPTTTDEVWLQNLDIAFALDIPHMSCYGLTVEARTALDHFIRTGKSVPVDDEQAARQYNLLVEQMVIHGYEQYEISNFARNGQYARHNTAYWQGIPYLGIGPSAHSFDGQSRQWNVAHNARYIQELQASEETYPDCLFEREELDATTRYNEYIMTGLRTVWGVCTDQMEETYRPYFEREAQKHLHAGLMVKDGRRYYLSKAGKLLADRLAMDLFAD